MGFDRTAAMVGDTLFTLSTGARGAPDAMAFFTLLEAAGDCVTRAIGHAVLAAETVEAGGRTWRSYADAFPTALGPDGPARQGPTTERPSAHPLSAHLGEQS